MFINFLKAFNTISHNYILKSLKSFNFSVLYPKLRISLLIPEPHLKELPLWMAHLNSLTNFKLILNNFLGCHASETMWRRQPIAAGNNVDFIRSIEVQVSR